MAEGIIRALEAKPGSRMNDAVFHGQLHLGAGGRKTGSQMRHSWWGLHQAHTWEGSRERCPLHSSPAHPYHEGGGTDKTKQLPRTGWKWGIQHWTGSSETSSGQMWFPRSPKGTAGQAALGEIHDGNAWLAWRKPILFPNKPSLPLLHAISLVYVVKHCFRAPAMIVRAVEPLVAVT